MGREDYSLLVILSLLILLIHDSAATTAPSFTISPSCQSRCGGIAIPYPFGIGKGCYLNKWYEIICKNSSGKPVLFLHKINREVVYISLRHPDYNSVGSVRIKNPITSLGCSSDEEPTPPLNVTGSPFFLTGNSLTAVGCNTKALMTNVELGIVGCESTCGARKGQGGQNMSCNGYRCCQTRISRAFLQVAGVRIESVEGNTTEGGCRVAFLTDKAYSLSNITEPERFHAEGHAMVELAWLIDTSDPVSLDSLGCFNATEDDSNHSTVSCLCNYGYYSGYYLGLTYKYCNCNDGFRGNPYITDGCKDIDECQEADRRGRNLCEGDTCRNLPGSYRCEVKKTWPIILGFSLGFGLLFLTIGAWWLHKFFRKRKKINRRKKFFKRNGGLLLQQQLTVAKGNIEKTRIFSSKELENATDKFSENRVLGRGGQGTVYKGMLLDGSIVAVKKSKVVDEDKLEEFINEVVILSQINHRNIVKLLGCCLETEVPILVYEFIPNGNLFEHLHHQFDDYTMTWEVRLRIATELAGALSYLHSAASTPVYHRDIKSTNILLDEKYRAKISDFGTSRSVTIDHTHLTATVTGTFGYMDPEYFRSSQFTDKSDVYSFGVVLVELLTGEKPVSLLPSQEGRSLAAHFILMMKENRLFDIIDARIKEDCSLEEVMAVSNLAKRCLSLNGKKRPNMREVSAELERIRSSPKDSKVQIQDDEDEEAMEINIGDSWKVVSTVPVLDKVVSFSLDVEPLVPYRTR